MQNNDKQLRQQGTGSGKQPDGGGVLNRVAAAVGDFAGRVISEADNRRNENLARTTGRLDNTWTARNSSNNRAYEAGVENRSTADWRAKLTSSTLAIIESLDTMLARSRRMIRNDGYAASSQGAYRRRVVGGGITARAAARHPDTGKMIKDFNRAHDLLWNSWALDPLLCDVEKTKCLYEKEALWMDELFAAGGLLLKAVYTPRNDAVGLAIQEIEYEQFNGSIKSCGSNAVYHGIETDAFGAPVAYHVYAASHPLEDTLSKSTRLEASAGCWHLFRKTRVRQRIGAPMMAAVMPALRNLSMYELYTISKARTEAAYHGFVEEPSGSGTPIDAIRARISGKTPDGAEDDNNVQIRVENGMFPVLRNGRKVSFSPPGTPNSVYSPFVQENLKRIAAGTGLDMPTVARWYAEGNFNTQRAAKLEIEAEVDAIQDLQFINGVLRGIRGTFTDIAISEGKLNAPGFATSAAWKAAYLTTNWQGPPRRSVDEIKDQAAWDMKYRSLRGTPQEYCNEQGKDIRDVLAEWQEFLELARDEYGLDPLLAKFFGTATQNAPKAGMRPDGTDADGDPSDADPTGKQGTGNNGDGNGDGKPDLSGLINDRLVMQGLFGGNED